MAADPGAPGRRLIFATRNAGKVAEMRELLAGSGWGIDPVPDDLEEYEETGLTFRDNARGKALFASRRVGQPVLADDSGLEIDALGGAPGVRSARYIDETISQEARNHAVLALLAEVPDEQRTARFVCHLVLAWRGAVIEEAVGACEGTITREPRGTGGFGYDPLFFVPALGATFAEIDRAQKSARSHRGLASRSMADFLYRWNP